MKNVEILNNSLLIHKITKLRDKNTTIEEFRELVNEITLLMAYNATKDLELKDIEIETPICKTIGKKIAHEDIVLIPIIRAGLGMVDSMLKVIPSAKVGFIGLARDEQTKKPHQYYNKLPVYNENTFTIILDPMLATGGSLSKTIELLKEQGAKKIISLNILAVPEGIERIQKDHPDVKLIIAQVDKKLNENAYIVPGLGDAGDRIYGTIK